MHVPHSAVSLARSMWWLSRARATGVLSVRSDRAVARVAFLEGDITSSAHEVRAMFCWSAHALHFDAGLPAEGVERRDSVSCAASILNGMCAACGAVALDRDDTRAFELTPWGRSLLEAAASSEDERRFLHVLSQGMSGAHAITAANGGERFEVVWCALRAFGALVPRAQSAIDYALLLRKRAQLRRRAGPRELLDLPPDVSATPAVARGALRRLTRRLHPDRLGPDAPAAAHALTTEVMQALTRAASSLG
jgi:hypothetical protein